MPTLTITVAFVVAAAAPPPARAQFVEPDVTVLHTCVADFDRNGVVNRRDSLAFLLAALLRDPRADSNCDGRVDGRDVVVFVLAVLFGCA